MKTNEYDFTLKFSLPASDTNAEIYVEALGEAGCDDAIIGIGQQGKIALQFTREAGNAYDAILSAIRQVNSVIPGAKLIEATPDLVGLTEIADIMGVSRQNVRKLMLTHIQTFPDPVHTGSSSIWHLANVLQWFETKQQKQITASIKEMAEANMQVNLVKESEKLNNRIREQFAALVA